MKYSRTTGYFAGSGRFSWIYPGANTTVTFENGTDLVVGNKAAVIGDFTGVTDGSSFYKKFCTPAANSSTAAVTSATSSATPSATAAAPGYPAPLFISADKQVSGYYLPNSDVAVLSMISFEPTIPVQFRQVVQKLLAAAKADGKTKLIVDLAANGGGLIFQGYDTFRQLFPQIVQDGNTRFRDTPEFMALSQVISGAFPPGFDPYTSNNDDLINLWETPNNYRYDINIENKPFSSYDEKFAPHQYNGDNFTSIIRWNFNDTLITSELPVSPQYFATNTLLVNKTYGVGEYITGYGPRTNFTQPFAAEDIVMLYDGYCASTCTIFSEFMRLQGGVKSIAYGGRPSADSSTPIIQAVGGVKGTNNYAYGYIVSLAKAALGFNITAAQKSLLKPLANNLPVQRTTGERLCLRCTLTLELIRGRYLS